MERRIFDGAVRHYDAVRQRRAVGSGQHFFDAVAVSAVCRYREAVFLYIIGPERDVGRRERKLHLFALRYVDARDHHHIAPVPAKRGDVREHEHSVRALHLHDARRFRVVQAQDGTLFTWLIAPDKFPVTVFADKIIFVKILDRLVAVNDLEGIGRDDIDKGGVVVERGAEIGGEGRVVGFAQFEQE